MEICRVLPVANRSSLQVGAWLGALMGSAAIVTAPAPAHAACVQATPGSTTSFTITASAGTTVDLDTCPGPAVSGATATVTGNVTAPAGGGAVAIVDGPAAADNWTLIINPGVTVQNDPANPGSPNRAIFGVDTNFRLENAGTITTHNTGDALFLGIGPGTGALVNKAGGTIQSLTNANAIQTQGDNTIINEAGATIAGGASAIKSFLGPAGTITNAGTITGQDSTAALDGAIDLQQGGAVTNAQGGRIEGEIGILSFGPTSIVNAGTITGTNGIAIRSPLANSLTLEIHPTSVINGQVSVFRLPGVTDTLRFGGVGAGTFDLDNIDGVNPNRYLGFDVFELTGGSWSFSGSTTQSLTVNGGQLKGTGTFGGLVFGAGSTFAPGNSIGTTNVNGNVVFGDNTIFQAEIMPDGSSDLLAATGTVTISPNGTTLQVIGDPAAAFPRTQTYTIITATGGVTGQFATLSDNLPDIDIAAVYTPTSVRLTYQQDSDTSDKTILPVSLAGALDAPRLFSHLLTGARGGTPTRNITSAQLKQPGTGRILVAANATSTMADASPHRAKRWHTWSTALGATRTVGASTSSSAYDTDTYGGAVGAQMSLAGHGNRTLGVAASYLTTQSDSELSDAETSSYLAGVYASANWGALDLSGGVGGGWQETDTTRVIPLIGGGISTANGRTQGATAMASVAALYDLSIRAGSRAGTRFGPFVTVNSIYAEQGGFTEKGAGVLNLTVRSTQAHQTKTGLGFKGEAQFNAGPIRVTAGMGAAWEHTLGEDEIAVSAALPLAAASFKPKALAADRSTVALTPEVSVEVTDRLSLVAGYRGSFGEETTQHQASAGFTWRF